MSKWTKCGWLTIRLFFFDLLWCSFIFGWLIGLSYVFFSLMIKVRAQEEKHVELLKAGKQAKHRLEELAPEIRLKGRGNFCLVSLSLPLLFHMHESNTLEWSWLNDALHLNHRKKPKTRKFLSVCRALAAYFFGFIKLKYVVSPTMVSIQSAYTQNSFDCFKLSWPLEWRLGYKLLLA